MNDLSFAAVVIIFVVVWWALTILTEKKQDRDYPALKFLMSITHIEETGIKRYLKYLLMLSGSIMGDDQRLDLKEQMKMAGINSTPEELLASQVMLGVGGGLVMFFISGITGNNIFFILAPVAGFIMFIQPKSMLKSKIKKKKNSIKNELPDFIDTLLLLIEAGFTPYHAIKQASQYSGGILGAEIKEMVIEMEAMSDEVGVMKRFAEKMQITELRNFVAAMIQSSTTDSSKAKEIYTQQALFMRELRLSNIRKLIKELPGRVKGYNFALFLIGMAIPLIPLALIFIGLDKKY